MVVAVGKVIRRRVSAGSKSDRDAVLLSTADGDYILRRRGGNPFRDAALDRWVGSTVRATGEIAGTTLIAEKIEPTDA